ncbi:MAG TPA: lysophospholipase [Aeromicrobium sp.]|nr:lysophospholipase [Aeromicrobium sp.]
MQIEDGTFAGTLGQTYWRAWLPDSRPDGVVVLVHGLAEHIGRYEYLAATLTGEGYAVYGLDHHGHGKSAGTPGNIGRMSALVADVHTLRGRAEAAHPGVRVFLVGHSLGGLITLDYLVTQGETGLSGAVLSGAAVDPSVGSALERAIAPVLSTLVPNLQIVDLGGENVSRDQDVVAAYQSDPLVYHGKIRARTGAESLKAIGRVTVGLPKLSLPVLVLHGGDDLLAAPSGGQLVHDTIGSTDKALKIYDGLYHEIFNEPEKDDVIGDVVAWLAAH